MIEIRQIKVPAGTPVSKLESKIRQKLKLKSDTSVRIAWRILRHATDARRKPELFDVYNVGVALSKIRKTLPSKESVSDYAADLPDAFAGCPASRECSRFTDYTESEEQRLIKKLRDPNIGIYKPVIYHIPEVKRTSAMRPVVIGAGPAGLFAALTLAKAGLHPLVLERGHAVEERVKDVENFWKTGRLNTESNIQFGEGGAGTFSDGKLTTNVKDKTGRNRAVLEAFVKAGANEDILYENLPHIGTDVLRKVVVNLRNEIIRLGGEVRFGCRVTDFKVRDGKLIGLYVNTGTLIEFIPCDSAVLAIGHSSRDTFRTLYNMHVPMIQKNFAVGFRLSHPQSMINQIQYGISDENEMKRLHLPAASYKLTAHTARRGVYSFCMCPGGYVVNASSENGRLAVNGMSNRARGSARANSAIVMTVTSDDFGSEDVLAGMRFQERLEEKAYKIGGGNIPVQKFTDFRSEFRGEGLSADNADIKLPNAPLTDKRTAAGRLPDEGPCVRKGDASWCMELKAESRLPAEDPCVRKGDASRCMGLRAESKFPEEDLCVRGGVSVSPLHKLLPKSMTEDFLTGMEHFDKVLPGFAGESAWVIGLESRTSSPVRILRDEHGESDIRGLYPCGEGAGYAGGIMSAAIDGIKTAGHIIAEE